MDRLLEGRFVRPGVHAVDAAIDHGDPNPFPGQPRSLKRGDVQQASDVVGGPYRGHSRGRPPRPRSADSRIGEDPPQAIGTIVFQALCCLLIVTESDRRVSRAGRDGNGTASEMEAHAAHPDMLIQRAARVTERPGAPVGGQERTDAGPLPEHNHPPEHQQLTAGGSKLRDTDRKDLKNWTPGIVSARYRCERSSTTSSSRPLVSRHQRTSVSGRGHPPPTAIGSASRQPPERSALEPDLTELLGVLGELAAPSWAFPTPRPPARLASALLKTGSRKGPTPTGCSGR